MSNAKSFVDVNGIRLCTDPAREACFKVVWKGSDMAQFEDESSPPAMREKLHRHMNNEIGSMEIAAQTLADFPDTPWELRMQIARQVYDESRHVEGLYRRLQELGGYKGEFPIANFEWQVVNTRETIAERLAIENRTLEAGQMDLLGTLCNLWRAAGDECTAILLETILVDEVSHVRYANRWIKKLAREDGKVVLRIAMAMHFYGQACEAAFGEEARSLQRADAKNHTPITINVTDRREAEFSEDEISAILMRYRMGSLVEKEQ